MGENVTEDQTWGTMHAIKLALYNAINKSHSLLNRLQAHLVVTFCPSQVLELYMVQWKVYKLSVYLQCYSH